MAIFNSYVSLPEGKSNAITKISCGWYFILGERPLVWDSQLPSNMATHPRTAFQRSARREGLTNGIETRDVPLVQLWLNQGVTVQRVNDIARPQPEIRCPQMMVHRPGLDSHITCPRSFHCCWKVFWTFNFLSIHVILKYLFHIVLSPVLLLWPRFSRVMGRNCLHFIFDVTIPIHMDLAKSKFERWVSICVH